MRTAIMAANLSGWILVAASAIPGPASAQVAGLDQLFKDHYQNHYEERRCGENALGFIEDAQEKLGAADSLFLVMIEDKGFSNFGLVQAEMARWPARPGQTQDMNWGFHAFVMDKSGNVYDFDYGPGPTITGMRRYLETMFIDDNECTQPPPTIRNAGSTCVKRETRLDEYQISVVPGVDIIARDESRQKKFKLSQVWKDWRVVLARD